MSDKGAPFLTIIVPMYDEQANVAGMAERVVGDLRTFGRPFEVILVDDGSRDGTPVEILAAAARYPELRGVFLARNYGQSTAMQAGFDHALGEVIVTLDGDLQNDPADIPAMVGLLEAEGADLVVGWRHQRQDRPLRMLVSRIANRLIARMTGVSVHDYGCSLKVYRREVVERMRLYGEMHRFIPAILAEVGGMVVEMKVRHHPRRHGQSKYGFDRTARVVLDLLLVVFMRRYIQRPLHLFGGVGLGLGAVGGVILVYLAGLKALYAADIGDRPLLLLGVMMVLLGGMLITQGVLGELLVRAYFATGARPQYHTRLAGRLRRLEQAAAERRS